MPILWTPNGSLDVSTDPSDLPEQSDGKSVVSGAMVECRNLTLDRMGIASTRRGSTRINSSPLPGGRVNCLIEQSGKRYAFAGASIYEDEVEIESGFTAADWSAIQYAPFNDETFNIYATNGIDKKRIEGGYVWEWGIDPPVASPTSTPRNYVYTNDWESIYITGYYSKIGIDTDDGEYTCLNQWEADYLNGLEEQTPGSTYYFTNSWELAIVIGLAETDEIEIVYTYCRYVDDVLLSESNPSPIGYGTHESGFGVTWLTSSDQQVTHVRIYRSLAGLGGAWYYDSKYLVGKLSAFLTKIDEELGAAVNTDHERIPDNVTQVIGPAFNGTIFALVGNKLYFCKNNAPDYWPALNYIEVGPPQFPLKAGAVFGGQLFVTSINNIYLVSGTGINTYLAMPMASQTGTQSPKVFCPIKGLGVAHLGYDNLYMYGSGQNANISKSQFNPIFEGTSINSLNGLAKTYINNCMAVNFENKIYLFYPSGTDNYCKNVLIFDLESKRATYYNYSYSEVSAICIDYTNNRLLAGTEDGYIWILEDLSATTDNGNAISWQLKTKKFVQFPKYFPRYLRFDLYSVHSYPTSYGYAYILMSEEIKKYYIIDMTRNIKRRLMPAVNGERLQILIGGWGPADIYGIQVE